MNSYSKKREYSYESGGEVWFLGFKIFSPRPSYLSFSFRTLKEFDFLIFFCYSQMTRISQLFFETKIPRGISPCFK